MRVAGSVVWSTDLVESEQTTGAKGQPDVTYSYSVSFAVALSSRPVGAIGRIWADGKLLRGAEGDFKVPATFRFYNGTETQDIDPLIGSIEGIANTPAYRGIAMAVFENLELAAGGAILKGRVERQVPDSGDAASLAIQLSGGDLDLDAMRAVASLATGKDTSAAFLAQTISADLQFRNLASQGVVASDVATAFSLKGGKLSLDRLTVGDLAGAALDLSGTASGSPSAPVLDLKGRIKAVDPRAFLLLAERNLPRHPVVSALASRSV